jgi:hypothetical protein
MDDRKPLEVAEKIIEEVKSTLLKQFLKSHPLTFEVKGKSRSWDSAYFLPRSIDRGNGTHASSPQGHPVREHLLTDSISRRGAIGASLQVLQ